MFQTILFVSELLVFVVINFELRQICTIFPDIKKPRNFLSLIDSYFSELINVCNDSYTLVETFFSWVAFL
jgi:hypothetical protein